MSYYFVSTPYCEVVWVFYLLLEIRAVERGICPIVTLYSPAAAFQRLTLL